MHLTVHPQLTSSGKKPHLRKLFDFGGGHGMGALPFCLFNSATAVIATDVRAELEKIKLYSS
jgi:hypothetical protein